MITPSCLDDIPELDDLGLCSLCCYREMRGQPFEAKVGQVWVVRNRTLHPGWWGYSYKTVILKPFQFSSFNKNDPNYRVFPKQPVDPAWNDCVGAAQGVMNNILADLTLGATYYYTRPLLAPPAAWGETKQLALINGVHFCISLGPKVPNPLS